MSNILLARIDSRLVHGQVATQWCRVLGANMILAVNDEAANNRLRQELMNMATPAHVSLRCWSVEKTCADIKTISKRQKILIVCATLCDLLTLIESGVKIPKVNIGNLSAGEGKRQLTTSVSVSEEDLKILEKIASSGTEIEFRRVPSEEPGDLKTLLGEK